MSPSMLIRRKALASMAVPRPSSVAMGMRFNSTKSASPFNEGPSRAESQPQISSERGKTTQLTLPLTAAALLGFALFWFTSTGDKKQLANAGVASEEGLNKLRSKSASRALEGAEK